MSITPMTHAKLNPANIPLSEDVQDIWHGAGKLASLHKSAVISDRYVLQAMLQSSRLFTRLDELLKHAEASPKRLKALVKDADTHYPGPGPESRLLDDARHIAAATANNGKPRVEIESLVTALLKSTDPLVQDVVVRAGLTEDKIEAAQAEVKTKSPQRFVLYCLRETFEVIFVVLFLVIVIKQGLGEFRLIPSESMLPTLQIGDRIVVEKISHWYRQPQRGDILVFYPPPPESILRNDPVSVFLRLTGFSGILFDKESKVDTAYIKRVVGLPGDVVDVRPGDGVYINNQKIEEPYVNEIANTCTFVDYCGPVEVPANSYYMMGDNRNHSADSRYWRFLPENRIIGRAVFRFFPIDNRFGTIGLSHPPILDPASGTR